MTLPRCALFCSGVGFTARLLLSYRSATVRLLPDCRSVAAAAAAVAVSEQQDKQDYNCDYQHIIVSESESVAQAAAAGA